MNWTFKDYLKVIVLCNVSLWGWKIGEIIIYTRYH